MRYRALPYGFLSNLSTFTTVLAGDLACMRMLRVATDRIHAAKCRGVLTEKRCGMLAKFDEMEMIIKNDQNGHLT